MEFFFFLLFFPTSFHCRSVTFVQKYAVFKIVFRNNTSFCPFDWLLWNSCNIYPELICLCTQELESYSRLCIQGDNAHSSSLVLKLAESCKMLHSCKVSGGCRYSNQRRLLSPCILFFAPEGFWFGQIKFFTPIQTPCIPARFQVSYFRTDLFKANASRFCLYNKIIFHCVQNHLNQLLHFPSWFQYMVGTKSSGPISM